MISIRVEDDLIDIRVLLEKLGDPGFHQQRYPRIGMGQFQGPDGRHGHYRITDPVNSPDKYIPAIFLFHLNYRPVFFSGQNRSVQPNKDSLTTEFTEIIKIIRVHKVFLSHLFGYYSVLFF